ncbi:hypothetical protein ACGTI2_08355 [Morganella morganii]|uniref:hypothetical protein n=1 Tax=Morganella morganii TaxID=582 RepID=UPI00386FF2CB
MSWKSEIEGLDIDQLRNFRDAINEAISQKEEETKRTVWRVCDRWMCLGNFREDDYLSAVDLLVETAKQRNAEGDMESMSIEIVRQRVPESEYESWFK